MKLPPIGKHAALAGNWVFVSRCANLDLAEAWYQRETMFLWGVENNIPIRAVDPYPYEQWRVLTGSDQDAVAVRLRWS